MGIPISMGAMEVNNVTNQQYELEACTDGMGINMA
jgi:hypothetical protein